jgi:uncharacterized membrane protein YGL010W
MIFVPLIYTTAIILAGLTPPIPIASNIPSVSIADVAVFVYAVGYILLEPVAGILLLPFHLMVAYYAHVLPAEYPRDVIVKWAAGLHVTSWIAQFAGHGLAEGRAPALFANLFQVYIPLFHMLILVIISSAIVCMARGFIHSGLSAFSKKGNR